MNLHWSIIGRSKLYSHRSHIHIGLLLYIIWHWMAVLCASRRRSWACASALLSGAVLCADAVMWHAPWAEMSMRDAVVKGIAVAIMQTRICCLQFVHKPGFWLSKGQAKGIRKYLSFFWRGPPTKNTQLRFKAENKSEFVL